MIKDSPLKDAVRAWLQELPGLTGKTLSAIAVEVGVNASTLTKAANSLSHRHVLSFSTISKIVAHYRVPPPAGLEAELAGLPTAAFTMPEATPFEFDPKHPVIGAAVRDFIKGRGGLQPYRLNTRMLELAGYLPGDIVVVDVSPEGRVTELKRSDVVLARIFDQDRDQSSEAWRIYDRPYLVTATTDSTSPRAVHQDAARIVGVVVMLFRPRRPNNH